MATAAQDKHKEVRRAAEVALSGIHRHLDSAAVAEVLSSEPSGTQAGLLRNLQVWNSLLIWPSEASADSHAGSRNSA